MAIHDFLCKDCGNEFEYLIMGSDDIATCGKCGGRRLKKLSPQSPITFKLKYDPKKDICDWNGETTRYYDEYKKQKKEGKNVRIAELDGDG